MPAMTTRIGWLTPLAQDCVRVTSPPPASVMVHVQKSSVSDCTVAPLAGSMRSGMNVRMSALTSRTSPNHWRTISM